MTKAGSLRADSVKTVLRYAYRLLGYRGRSEKEMAEKLRTKGFSEDEVNKCISILRANNYINDKELAFSLKRHALEIKHLGNNGARNFLRARGIPVDIIDEILHDIDETETAASLVKKKMSKAGEKNPALNIRKIYGVLLRKGYTYETIGKTLKRMRLKEDTGHEMPVP